MGMCARNCGTCVKVCMGNIKMREIFGRKKMFTFPPSVVVPEYVVVFSGALASNKEANTERKTFQYAN